ncbi:hypothetical protein SFOMI_2698 [Sphingobium fuliginis]|uniref:Uncharacterized protein n=1 Tax=Sphingobium fuliginis (strain ATCC 27551) TaxID=336203 RepID=A0A292ZH22_SPHSA|nr:hypothetical protein SFOMI_2698 [Sphingobium fuliginis]
MSTKIGDYMVVHAAIMKGINYPSKTGAGFEIRTHIAEY